MNDTYDFDLELEEVERFIAAVQSGQIGTSQAMAAYRDRHRPAIERLRSELESFRTLLAEPDAAGADAAAATQTDAAATQAAPTAANASNTDGLGPDAGGVDADSADADHDGGDGAEDDLTGGALGGPAP